MSTNKEIETVNLPVIRYRDSKGNPTCAKNFPKGEVCQFYRTARLGTEETCVFANGFEMERRDEGKGYLIPLDNCPIWKDRK